MMNRVATAALQYSKWLSRFISWVWAIYRFTILIASVIRPSIAEAAVLTTNGMDTIMLVNVSTYLVNSLGEKWLYSDRFLLKWLDKGGFKNLVGNIVSKAVSSKKEEIDEEDGENDGDDNNG